MSTPQPAAREHDPFRATRWSPRVRWRLTPWWAKVVAVYFGARLITTTIVLVLAGQQAANPWTGSKPGYFEYANLWDARWYQIIWIGGYPRDLPITDAGHVGENAWAFLPVFPALSGVLTWLGLPWNAASVTIAVLAGLGAALVLHRLMSRFLEPDRALFAVVLFAVAPVSPIMQFGYAESLGFLWLALALLLLVDRRYGWLVPVLAAWAFTRPGALAFALTLGLHWIWRWWQRERDPFPMRERVVAASVTAFAVVVGFAWPGIVWFVTGRVRRVHGDRARVAVGVHRVSGARAVHRLVPGRGVVGRVGAAARGARHGGRRGAHRELRGDAVPARGASGSASTSGCGSRATGSTCWRCSSRSRAPSESSRRCSRSWARSPCRGRDGTGGESSCCSSRCRSAGC